MLNVLHAGAQRLHLLCCHVAAAPPLVTCRSLCPMQCTTWRVSVPCPVLATRTAPPSLLLPAGRVFCAFCAAVPCCCSAGPPRAAAWCDACRLSWCCVAGTGLGCSCQSECAARSRSAPSTPAVAEADASVGAEMSNSTWSSVHTGTRSTRYNCKYCSCSMVTRICTVTGPGFAEGKSCTLWWAMLPAHV